MIFRGLNKARKFDFCILCSLFFGIEFIMSDCYTKFNATLLTQVVLEPTTEEPVVDTEPLPEPEPVPEPEPEPENVPEEAETLEEEPEVEEE